jgi:hypothetical protein
MRCAFLQSLKSVQAHAPTSRLGISLDWRKRRHSVSVHLECIDLIYRRVAVCEPSPRKPSWHREVLWMIFGREDTLVDQPANAAEGTVERVPYRRLLTCPSIVATCRAGFAS